MPLTLCYSFRLIIRLACIGIDLREPKINPVKDSSFSFRATNCIANLAYVLLVMKKLGQKKKIHQHYKKNHSTGIQRFIRHSSCLLIVHNLVRRISKCRITM